MKISGIYQIQSKVKPERIYIGSAVDIKRRWHDHLCSLRNNKHGNLKLQRHFLKYNEEDFIFSVLLNCEKEELINIEQYYIDFYQPFFNIAPKAYSSLGIKRSDETKKKLSLLHKGRKLSEERKKQMSIARIGRKLTPEHIEKLKYYSGKNHPCYGKKCSEETKRKLSLANRGKTHPMSKEARLKISKALKGKKKSQEFIEYCKERWRIKKLKKIA